MRKNSTCKAEHIESARDGWACTRTDPVRYPDHPDACSKVLIDVSMVAISINALAPVIVPDELHQIIKSWGKPGQVGEGLSSWPTDFSRGIFPIPCHSHNDYWRLVPLYSAIEAGCISVEADIWLINDELYVGHTPASLTPNRTLDSLYISPLLDILSKQNPSTSFHDGDASLDGVFDTTPSQSLVLLIDFKTPGSELWPHVLAALQPLRDRGYLTHVNGTQIVQRPITVVGTGNTPFDLVSSVVTNPHLDVFFDAPLGEMYVEEGNEHSKAQHNASISADSDVYTTVNSFYASVSFGEVFGHLFYGEFSEQQLTTLRGQLRGAHEKGLKARYWDLPFWPIGLRNHVWDVLVNEGVDLLNVDDLKGATEKDWKKSKGWW